MDKKLKRNSVLWENKISFKNNIFFIKTRYALIYKDRIIIRKNAEEDSQIIEDIKKDRVVSIIFPKFGAKEALVTGFKGFIVRFKKDGKEKTLSFWAKGFGAYPDLEKMKTLVKAIAVFTGKKYSEVKDTAESYTFVKYIILSISMVVGYLVGGLIGILLIGILRSSL